jgi:RNA polymerase sigma-70 factor, ECF subfamily
MHTTPASLLERLRGPTEQAAWNRFVALYAPLLYHWCRRLGLPYQDALDLVQDVLLLLLRKLPDFTYNPSKRFRGWLWTLLANKHRENQRRRAVTSGRLEPHALAELAGPDEISLIDEEEYRQHLVQRALQLMRTEFEPTTWQACWQYVVVGKSVAEVAAELGMSPGAVRAAKFRVISRLRSELNGLLE